MARPASCLSGPDLARILVPFILLGLAVVGALIYGAVRLYQAVAAAFGALAGIGAVALAIALFAALVASVVRRYRAIHGVNIKGERILSLHGPWGSIRIDAEQKHGLLAVNDARSRFIFADIAGAEPASEGGAWSLALRLEHNARSHWRIPMPTRKEAQRWAKIFSLAAEQNGLTCRTSGDGGSRGVKPTTQGKNRRQSCLNRCAEKVGFDP